MLMYVEDNEEMLPPAEGWCATVSERGGLIPNIWDCPSNALRGSATRPDYLYMATVADTPYGEIAQPDTTILTLDGESADGMARRWSDVRYRHIGKCLAAFADGHVAFATPSGLLTEKIVYESNESGNFDIWIMNTDGSDKRQLTTTPDDDRSPQLSPDGTKIAFSTTRSGNEELWVMDVDSENLRQLTHTGVGGWFKESDWSPDGSKLVYGYVTTGSYVTYIGIVNADGTGERIIYSDPGRGGGFSWAPKTDMIVFNNETVPNSASSDEIWKIKLDGTGCVRLTNNAVADTRPSVSPDGSKILFCRATGGGERLFVMNMDGSNVTQVVVAVSGNNNQYRNEWSPDGTRLCFELQVGGNIDIAVANADGSGMIAIANTAFTESLPDWGVARE